MEKLKIVVIDDEKDIGFLMKRALERTGLYTVFTAENGFAGEKICFSEKPNLIFLDYVLPDETGDDVVASLKSKPETKNIPIVLMSGLGEMHFVDKNEQWEWLPNTKAALTRPEIPDPLKWRRASEEVAKELGVTVYLRKPFTKETLVAVAREILGIPDAS